MAMLSLPAVIDLVASLLVASAPVAACPSSVDALPLPAAYAEDERLRAPSVVVVSKAQRRMWLFEEGQLAG